MFFKQITMACAAAALLAVPATQADADGRDFLAGAVLGGIAGAVINNNVKKQRRTVRRTYKKKTYRPGIPSTSEGAQLQSALNYFGYNAGRVDGQVGSGTRNAVSRYQASMGYYSDGHIDPQERSLLIGAHNWAVNGGAATAGGLGGVALLRNYQQRLATNTLYQPNLATQPVVTFQQAQPQTQTIVVAPQAVQPAATEKLPVVTEVVSAAPKAAATGLPSFMGAAKSASLASHCNQVNLLTSTNGGFVTAGNVVNADQALNEQFCLARTYAIKSGEDLMAGVQGFTSAQVEEQCQGFGAAMKDHVAALSLKPQSAVVNDVSDFVLSSGMSPEQLSGISKICLGVGYRKDSMDVAVGSALLLATLGEQAYGELMGHHLSQGIGASKRADLSLAWYEMGLQAVETGGQAVFAPGQPERSNLIRKAAYMVGDTSQSRVQPQVQPASTNALPTFQVSQ